MKGISTVYNKFQEICRGRIIRQPDKINTSRKSFYLDGGFDGIKHNNYSMAITSHLLYESKIIGSVFEKSKCPG